MAKYRDTYDYVNTNLDASKIKFLSGTQEQLNKYLLGSEDSLAGKAQEGTFYLTSDTHRLYIGRAITVSGSTKVVPVPVNEGIETVQAIGNLPQNANQGEFYYIAGQNILAVRSGNSLVQLNTDTHIGSVASTVHINESSNVITDVDVRTTITDSNGNVYGTNALDQWKLIPGNNVVFSYTPADTTAGSEASARLTVTAIDTTYTVGTTTSNPNGIIALTPSGSNASGSNVQLVSKTTNSANQSKQGDLSITSDNAGNITFDLKETEGISVAARSGNAGGFSISPIIDGAPRAHDNGVLDPIIRFGATTMGLGAGEVLSGVTSGATDIHFSAGIASLDVYSRLQTEKRIEDVVNQKIQVADALTYIGTASYDGTTDTWSYSDGTNTISTFHKGDTFKVNSINGTPLVSGISVKVGDLLIANGTENSSGVISSNLSWNLIPSGDEPVYSVAQDTANKKTTLQSTLNSTVENVGSVTYAADDDWISSVLTVRSAGDTNATIKYSHNNKNLTSTISTDDTTLSYTGADTSDKLTFLALDASSPFTIDKGHITGIKGKQVSIALNKLDKMYSIGSNYSNEELNTGALLSGAKINLKIHDKKSGTPIELTNKEIRYTSKTLMITGSTENSLTDNQYGIINVDLQWGTF